MNGSSRLGRPARDLDRLRSGRRGGFRVRTGPVDVESRFPRDQLLTNLTIYWATETINSSTRVYYEERQAPPVSTPVTVPAGFPVFANEFVPEGRPPRELAGRIFDVRRRTEHPSGGHFAALEEPAVLAEEIRAFFRPLRSAQL